METIKNGMDLINQMKNSHSNSGGTKQDVENDKLQDLANFLGEQEIKLKNILKGETNDDVFTELCKPLMKYLAENHNPHSKIIIESTFAEIVQGIKTTGIIHDFLVD